MEDRRVYLNAEHHTRRGKSFALLVILGLGVVFLVWFLQLQTLFTRGEGAEVNARVAAFQAGLQEEWAALDSAETSESDLRTTTSNTIQELITTAAREQDVRDVIGNEVVNTLTEEGDAELKEEGGAATESTTDDEAEATVTPTTPDEGVTE